MANLAEKLPTQKNLYQTLFPQLIDYEGTEAFIAGGWYLASSLSV